MLLLASITSCLAILAIPTIVKSTPLRLSSRNVTVTELGINCRGSFLCIGNSELLKLRNMVKTINPMHHYWDHDYIACIDMPGMRAKHGGICAFLQSTGTGLPGSDILDLVDSLVEHGCANCGSVPIDYPYINDASRGILTVNFVQSMDCRKEKGYKWRDN